MSVGLPALQSVLEPFGPVAADSARLTWILIGGASVILLGVMAIALYAAFTRRRQAMSRISENALIIGGGVIFPVLVLSALLLYSVLRAADLSPEEDPHALHVEVTAEQWWWRINYLQPGGTRDFTLANELRLPIGKTVVLHLKSADVIHSFWVPSLGGKLDMIPGRTNTLRIKADRTGTVRGQCAEYCGGPHALMALSVVIHTVDDYASWAHHQRQPARATDSATHDRGETLFMARCASCHAVRGTRAAGRLGPDLTHMGSRLTLGAGVLPMSTDTLMDWIGSAQRHKPGSLMPEFSDFKHDELRAVANYVLGLQ